MNQLTTTNKHFTIETRFEVDSIGTRGVVARNREQKNSAAFAYQSDNCIYECNA